MRKITLVVLCFTFLALQANSQLLFWKKGKLADGIYAEFTTDKGIILCELEYQKTPMTVANFVGLAEGKFTALDSIYTKPFYDSIKFHRVIQNFMIQGGDPTGTGSGGPYHRFFDEVETDLKHDKPGTLSMANSGPNTNGSQFFITHLPTPHLDGRHTVFGYVVKGQNIVDSILQNDYILKVKIIRKGKTAKKWNATKVFKHVYDSINVKIEADKKLMEQIKSMSVQEYNTYFFNKVKEQFPNAQQTASGLVYIIEKQGTTKKVQANDLVSLHYKGTFFKDGNTFDSSYDRNQPMDFNFKTNRMIPGFEEGLEMLGNKGKAKLFIPYHLAYGDKGRPGSMPAYSDLVFDIELMNVTLPKNYKQDGIAFLEENKNKEGIIVTPSGLQYEVIKQTEGPKPTSTSKVTVHYHGTTPDGIVFDSSVERGETISFGLNQVIPGWTEGLQLMSVGSKYKFYIPANLAYGSRPPQGGNGPIKADMPLVFEVELFGIE
jgi:peptidyl-prolyl cis-trans isomerase A (cyclophilin A)